MKDPLSRRLMSLADAAAYWVVKTDQRSLSQREQTAFERWLAEPCAAEAYLDARLVWIAVGHMQLEHADLCASPRRNGGA